MEQRIVTLEIKLSFLEETLDTLNEVILAQGKELEAQRKKLERLEQPQGDAGQESAPADERPPHY